jgi:hypothetical protein
MEISRRETLGILLLMIDVSLTTLIVGIIVGLNLIVGGETIIGYVTATVIVPLAIVAMATFLISMYLMVMRPVEQEVDA